MAATTQMFGLIIAGRMVESIFTAVSPGKFTIAVHQPETINHIVVFLTGAEPFPAGYGGQIYFNCPAAGGENWLLLGHITNEKPSAIFRVGNLKPPPHQQPLQPVFAVSMAAHAQIGVSVEPLEVIRDSTPIEQSQPTSADLALRMLDNFHNYMASFGAGVRTDLVQRWYEGWRRKVQDRPGGAFRS